MKKLPQIVVSLEGDYCYYRCGLYGGQEPFGVQEWQTVRALRRWSRLKGKKIRLNLRRTEGKGYRKVTLSLITFSNRFRVYQVRSATGSVISNLCAEKVRRAIPGGVPKTLWVKAVKA